MSLRHLKRGYLPRDIKLPSHPPSRSFYSFQTTPLPSISSNTSPKLPRRQFRPVSNPSNIITTARYSTTTDAMSEEPTGLIAKSGIELLTFGTPNGFKASILLEELKDAYGTEYTSQSINIMKNTQKEPWFIDLNPNGRIPVIVDHNRGGFPVFEGLSILTYLTRHYDPEHKFSFPVDSNEYSEAEQWMAWQHGGLGPMQGQANHFVRYGKDKPTYAVQRYVGETERLYGILDARLSSRDYIVGNKFSIADMAIVGWADIAMWSGMNLDQFPNVKKWLDRCHARSAVQRGFAVPSASSVSNEAITKQLADGVEEVVKREEEARKRIQEAKEEWGYKYVSP